MAKVATVENMREAGGHPVIAYSPTTGETSSADASDYFWLPEGEPLLDEEGEPMILVRQQTTFVEV